MHCVAYTVPVSVPVLTTINKYETTDLFDASH